MDLEGKVALKFFREKVHVQIKESQSFRSSDTSWRDVSNNNGGGSVGKFSGPKRMILECELHNLKWIWSYEHLGGGGNMGFT